MDFCLDSGSILRAHGLDDGELFEEISTKRRLGVS